MKTHAQGQKADQRKCRECGQPIESRRIVYGRNNRAEDWFVHINSDRVPCDPKLKAKHRLSQQEHQAQ